MISYENTYDSYFSTKQLFDLVRDVEKYPEFLPWCSAARIISKEEDHIIAELVIFLAPLSHKYTSKVKLFPPKDENDDCKIIVELVEGPFEKLDNKWHFIRDGNKTKVKFEIDFKFQSKMLQAIMGSMFEKSLKKMTDAFENRANEIYSEK